MQCIENIRHQSQIFMLMPLFLSLPYSKHLYQIDIVFHSDVKSTSDPYLQFFQRIPSEKLM